MTGNDDAATRRAVDALRHWEGSVDDARLARLAAGRRRALAATEGNGHRALTWRSAVAALLLLAVGLSIFSQEPKAPDPALLQSTIEASQYDLIEAQEAELLLDEDIDLYLWLVSQPEAT